MTTALGIAAVTAVLSDLLHNGLVEWNLSGLLGVGADVSTLPPDRVVPADGNEPTCLNLFLHRVSANAAWRNEGLPGRDPSGRERRSNPPLALDLHYLLSAYSRDALHAEVLLGHALQWLHERPVLTREMIRRALEPAPAGTPLQRALAACGLAEQIERVSLTPEPMEAEENARLWSAFQSHLRPSVAYRATVLLIQSEEPVRAPLPVLTRGRAIPGGEEGVRLTPSLVPALPTLTAVSPGAGDSVVRLGVPVELSGHHLDGTTIEVLLENERFQLSLSQPADPGGGDDRIRFSLPISRAEEIPVGTYRVAVRLTRPGEAAPRESNRLALTLAPDLLGLPATVNRDGDGSATVEVTCRPALQPSQRAALVLGDREYPPEPPAGSAPWSVLRFAIADAPVTPPAGWLARLRIDGIDSPLIDRSTTPPSFLNQRLVIT